MSTITVQILDQAETVEDTPFQDEMTAWEYFTQTAMDLEPGYTIQILIDGVLDDEYVTGQD